MSVDTDVRQPAKATFVMHLHEWVLRETEFEDGGLLLRRFECACGAVDYA